MLLTQSTVGFCDGRVCSLKMLSLLSRARKNCTCSCKNCKCVQLISVCILWYFVFQFNPSFHLVNAALYLVVSLLNEKEPFHLPVLKITNLIHKLKKKIHQFRILPFLSEVLQQNCCRTIDTLGDTNFWVLRRNWRLPCIYMYKVIPV